MIPGFGWGLRAGAPLTHVRGLPSRERLLGLSDSGGRPRCSLSVRVLGWTCTRVRSWQRRLTASPGSVLQARLTPSFEHIQEWIKQLPGPVAVAYEAGPTGFGLYRALTGAGLRCEVLAPSKLQKPAGDRVKTDARDALHLARLLRLDEVTSVSIPSVNQEACSDLGRAREDCRGDLMRARHRLSKLLLRHGVVYHVRCGLDRCARSLASRTCGAAVTDTGDADGVRFRLRARVDAASQTPESGLGDRGHRRRQ